MSLINSPLPSVESPKAEAPEEVKSARPEGTKLQTYEDALSLLRQAPSQKTNDLLIEFFESRIKRKEIADKDDPMTAVKKRFGMSR